MLSRQIRLVWIVILGQIRCLRVRARLESTAYANQVRGVHVRCQRIAAWFPNFTLDIYRGWLDHVRVPVNQKAVPWLQNDVFDRISTEGLSQTNAEDLELA